MSGGDLINLLIERDILEEDFTHFYVAEVLHTRTLVIVWPPDLLRIDDSRH